MNQRTRALICVTMAAALSGWGCSSQDDASQEVTGPHDLVGASSVSGIGAMDSKTTDPLPVPSPSPSAPTIIGGACPVGDGRADAACGAGSMTLFEPVDAAVSQVVAQHPELFDMNRVIGEGGYRVLDVDRFYAEVVERLQAAGLCASYDFTRFMLQVKRSDASSEDYMLVGDNGHLRRGTGSYVTTCTPAAFPLEPSEVIAYVRVGFYGIECYDGQARPGNNDRKLPVDCFGLVTATPKKADGTDVDSRIHGPEVAWTLSQVDDYVSMDDDPAQPFNKVMRGLDPGEFTVCATVQGIEGCMTAEVLAY